MVLGCLTRIGHSATHAAKLAFVAGQHVVCWPTRGSSVRLFDVSGQPCRRRMPGVSIIDERLPASPECSAFRRIAQKFIESIYQLRCVFAFDHVAGPTLLDEIRHCSNHSPHDAATSHRSLRCTTDNSELRRRCVRLTSRNASNKTAPPRRPDRGTPRLDAQDGDRSHRKSCLS
jgi:hypothetical protein